jgi:hypothetical protein
MKHNASAANGSLGITMGALSGSLGSSTKNIVEIVFELKRELNGETQIQISKAKVRKAGSRSEPLITKAGSISVKMDPEGGQKKNKKNDVTEESSLAGGVLARGSVIMAGNEAADQPDRSSESSERGGSKFVRKADIPGSQAARNEPFGKSREEEPAPAPRNMQEPHVFIWMGGRQTSASGDIKITQSTGLESDLEAQVRILEKREGRREVLASGSNAKQTPRSNPAIRKPLWLRLHELVEEIISWWQRIWK